MSELGSLGEMGVMFQRAPFLDLLTESLIQDTGHSSNFSHVGWAEMHAIPKLLWATDVPNAEDV